MNLSNTTMQTAHEEFIFQNRLSNADIFQNISAKGKKSYMFFSSIDNKRIAFIQKKVKIAIAIA